MAPDPKTFVTAGSGRYRLDRHVSAYNDFGQSTPRFAVQNERRLAGERCKYAHCGHLGATYALTAGADFRYPGRERYAVRNDYRDNDTVRA